MAEPTTPVAPIPLRLDTHPAEYIHWKLSFDGPVAKLEMNVQEDKALRDGEYILKLNSYDLGVDVELSDAIQRVRFEHPEVRALVVSSAIDRIFCSGANIYMLGSSGHGFKVNFCKYTNETRLYLEDLAENSGVTTLCAVNGTASGGGYELALACDKIYLVDDGNSAVSFPETPLLAVLPGTGGLTRLVDKRKVRRDRADVFSTLVEGIRGKRAVEWNLVDEVIPKSRWAETLKTRVQEAVQKAPEKKGAGLILKPLTPELHEHGIRHRYVELNVDESGRVGTLTLKAPSGDEPKTSEALRSAGNDAWMLRAFRELDDTLIRVRFHHPKLNLIVLKTAGDAQKLLAAEQNMLALAKEDWLAKEVLLLAKRALKRLDLTARSLFALVEPGSCFAGSFFELLLAADRSYMLNDPDRPTAVYLSELNGGLFPMSNGLSRLQTHFLGEPKRVEEALAKKGKALDAETAEKMGLVTFAPDELDWEDEVRIAIEERANFSPDALTGMEANLRFAGPETMETKIFGRLSAWQNWIFQRPNAVGPKGALTSYGKQTRPEFDVNRT
ncbi:MAG: 2,3-epoxybenzoyl-CoA dihydrolase [Myxococcota bacterium]